MQIPRIMRFSRSNLSPYQDDSDRAHVGGRYPYDPGAADGSGVSGASGRTAFSTARKTERQRQQGGMLTRGDNLIVAIGAALSRRFANALFEYNRIVTLRNLRRALRHMNHPAADADDAEIMGVLAVMGYAIIHCGTFDMTVEQFRTAARDWRNRPPPLPVVTDREHL